MGSEMCIRDSTYTLSCTYVILSDTLFATYEPVDVRESAPITTPPSYSTAMMVVCDGGARSTKSAHAAKSKHSAGMKQVQHAD